MWNVDSKPTFLPSFNTNRLCTWHVWEEVMPQFMSKEWNSGDESQWIDTQILTDASFAKYIQFCSASSVCVSGDSDLFGWTVILWKTVSVFWNSLSESSCQIPWAFCVYTHLPSSCWIPFIKGTQMVHFQKLSEQINMDHDFSRCCYSAVPWYQRERLVKPFSLHLKAASSCKEWE